MVNMETLEVEFDAYLDWLKILRFAAEIGPDYKFMADRMKLMLCQVQGGHPTMEVFWVQVEWL